MRRLLTAAAAILLLPFTTVAFAGQGLPTAVEGRVLDATRAPIEAARVALHASPDEPPVSTALTDARGTFRISASPGVYVLRIDAPGFLATARPLTLGAAPLTTADFVLQIAGILESVTVGAPGGYRVPSTSSATKTPTPLLDVPQSVSIVSSALIADQRLTSMADVVRYMPGVGMAQGEGNRDTPVIRGNSSTADFFVNGVRDDVQYFRDTYNLERVEAMKGPNALIFGRGGGGGIINRVTREADWGRSREVAVQLGSWDNRRVTADFGTAVNGAVAARVTGMYEDSDSYRKGVGVERFGINPTVAVHLGPRTLLRAGYEHFHDERTADRGIPSFMQRPVRTAPGTFFGDPALSPTAATVNALRSVVEHRAGNGLVVRNRVSYAAYDKFYQNVFPGAVDASGTRVSIGAYRNETDRSNLFNQTDVTIQRRTGGIEHTLLVGVELGRQVTDNFRRTGYFTSLGPSVRAVLAPLDDPTISLPVEFRQSATDADNHGVATVAAVYAQDQVALTSQIEAVVGLRFDAFDVDFRNNRTGAALESRDGLVSPRLGLVYKPVPTASIYGSYSVSYLPRAGDQLSSLSLTNLALEPETFRNYEVGAKWDVTPSLGASAAVYRLDRGNVASPDPEDPTRSILVDGQRTHGLELEMNGQLTDGWSITAGYAYQHGEITESLSSNAQAGASLAHLPRHSLSLWSKYAVSRLWSVGLGVVHKDRIYASTDNTVILPRFTRVDAGVFFDPHPKLRVQVNVENLLDEAYYASAHNNNNITPGSPRGFRLALMTRF